MLYPDIGLTLYERDVPPPSIVTDGLVCYRGPAVNTDDDYWVCVGTAMTFGRFAARPYPAILNDAHPTINFGFGHLESRLIAKSRPHRNILQRASLVIIQYSPLDIYLEGLNLILEAAQRSLVVVFRDIQVGDHSQFRDAIVVPGGSLEGCYPTQETHDRAAAMILERVSSRSSYRP